MMESMLNFGMENFMQEVHAQAAYERQKNLMIKKRKMDQAAAINAYPNMVQSMRMAGLNPAAASGQSPIAFPAASASADFAGTMPINPQVDLVAAQLDKLNAEKENVQEDTRSKRNTNDITDAANDAAAQTWVSSIDREIKDLEGQLSKTTDSAKRDELQARIGQLTDSKAAISDPDFRGALGIAQGFKSGAEGAKANFDIVNNYLQGKLDQNVLAKKLSNGTADILATVPHVEREQLRTNIEHIRQLIAESESKEELNDQQVFKLQTEIEQIGDIVLRARLSDENFLRTMAKEAPTAAERKAWEGRLDNLTDTEFRKLKYDVGSGIVKGLATGGAIGGAGSLASKILGGDKKFNGKGVKSFDEMTSEERSRMRSQISDHDQHQSRFIYDRRTNSWRAPTDDEVQGMRNFKF